MFLTLKKPYFKPFFELDTEEKLGTKAIFLDFPKNTTFYVCFVNYFVYLTLDKSAKIIYTILMKKCKFGLHSDMCCACPGSF